MFPKDTNILIVDDMMTMRRFVKKVLAELGYEKVTDAAHGAAAWEKIVEAEKACVPFQLIISDWNMPDVTGIELLERCRTQSQNKDVPFVLLTAESEKDQVAQANELKVSAYVVKPFNVAILGERLAAVYAAR